MCGIPSRSLSWGRGIGRKGSDDGLDHRELALGVDGLLVSGDGLCRRLGVSRLSIEEEERGVAKAVGFIAVCSVPLA